MFYTHVDSKEYDLTCTQTMNKSIIIQSQIVLAV